MIYILPVLPQSQTEQGVVNDTSRYSAIRLQPDGNVGSYARLTKTLFSWHQINSQPMFSHSCCSSKKTTGIIFL